MLSAVAYNSGFPLAHDTYNGLSVARDGRVYYVLCSQSIDTGGQIYRFDPRTEAVSHLGDLTEICGEKDLRAVPQGKSHVAFSEYRGKLYFATHAGYYNVIDGRERMATRVPPGYARYPGGHLLSYDLTSGLFEDLGIAPDGEAVLSLSLDERRGALYGITWPSGLFFRYDIARKEWRSLGPVAGLGEAGAGAAYRVLCRSVAVDQETGTAYFTNPEGDLLCCRAGSGSIEALTCENMRKDYFGQYDPAAAGSMGYNWRQTVWHPVEKVFYGVHGNSGYLFRFDPAAPRLEVLDRLTSAPSKRSGMFDQFSYGYLGFTLGPDNRTLYYLTGGPIFIDGKRVAGKERTAMGEAKGLENVHLVTYDIPAALCLDHGPVFYADGQRPTYVNSIAVGADGSVYTLARVTDAGRTRTDLIRIRP